MVYKKTIGISALTLIIGALLMLGGVSLTDENAYYCSDRGIVMNCDSLSKYYGLDNGKCNNAEVGNKLCTSGWVQVIDGTIQLRYSINIDAEQELWLNSTATKKGVTPEQELQDIVTGTIKSEKHIETQKQLWDEISRLAEEDKLEEAVIALKNIK